MGSAFGPLQDLLFASDALALVGSAGSSFSEVMAALLGLDAELDEKNKEKAGSVHKVLIRTPFIKSSQVGECVLTARPFLRLRMSIRIYTHIRQSFLTLPLLSSQLRGLVSRLLKQYKSAQVVLMSLMLRHRYSRPTLKKCYQSRNFCHVKCRAASTCSGSGAQSPIYLQGGTPLWFRSRHLGFNRPVIELAVTSYRL